MFKYLAIFSLLFSVACSTASIEDIPASNTTKNPYKLALAKEYLTLSEIENRNFAFSRSSYFSKQAMKSAYGKTVEIKNPLLKNMLLDKIFKEKTIFNKYVNTDTKKQYPAITAKVFSAYDCWIKRQTSNAGKYDIDLCKNIFYKNIAILKQKNKAKAKYFIKKLPKERKWQEPKLDLTSFKSYILYFKWNLAKLTRDSLAKLTNIVSYIKNKLSNKKYEITINGHTDKSGSDSVNLEMALKRAEAIKIKMVKSGISADNISVFSFGETDPAVPTKDGVREPANRRVEISIDIIK